MSDPKKPRVELYDCLLRHGGNKEHEIPKQAVTAREIQLMRAMHGDESILDSTIKPHLDEKKVAAYREVEPKVELFELARKYANTMDPMSGKKLVEKVFNTALIGFDRWFEEAMELERMEQEEGHQRRNAEMTKRRQEAQHQAAA